MNREEFLKEIKDLKEEQENKVVNNIITNTLIYDYNAIMYILGQKCHKYSEETLDKQYNIIMKNDSNSLKIAPKFKSIEEHSPTISLNLKHLDSNTIDQFVEEFYKTVIFENQLYDDNKRNIIRDINLVGSIEANDRTYGHLFHLLEKNRNFIFIRDNQNIHTASVICHELGHAKVNQNSSYNDIEHTDTSQFMETIPVFYQFLFMDYLNNKIDDNEINQIRNLVFNSTGCRVYESLNYKISNYYLSYLTALYLYKVFKKNPDKALKLSNKFIKLSKMTSDEEVMKELSLSPKKLLKSYNYYQGNNLTK